MLKILLSSALSISLLNALTINELVIHANENNYDLKSVEKSIEIANQQILLSKNWQNPVLSLGINGIWLNDISSRDNEPMQASFIGISQIIPTGKKLELKEDIAIKDKNIQTYILEDKRLQFESKIYEYVYTIVILEEKYKLLDLYEQNINNLESLYTSLYKYQKASQNQILNTQVSTLELKLQKQNLRNMIDNLYLKLQNISYIKINKIDEKIDIKKTQLLVENIEHPRFKILEEDANKSKDKAALESAKKVPDVQVNMAYFQRDNKFNDYVNLSVSFPLSIYKTEDIGRLQANLRANETMDNLEQLKHSFSLETQILQNTLNSAYSNYELIKEKIIPLKEKVQKNIENYNSFDKIKPEESIKNLNELINYETKAIDELQKYYEAYSQLIYFTNKGIK